MCCLIKRRNCAFPGSSRVPPFFFSFYSFFISVFLYLCVCGPPLPLRTNLMSVPVNSPSPRPPAWQLGKVLSKGTSWVAGVWERDTGAIFGPMRKAWTRAQMQLHNEDYHNLCCWWNNIAVVEYSTPISYSLTSSLIFANSFVISQPAFCFMLCGCQSLIYGYIGKCISMFLKICRG